MSTEIVAEMTAGRAGAIWWADQIGAPVFKTVPDGDHEDREYGDTTSFLAGVLASRHPVRDGQGAAFVEALTPVLDAQLERYQSASLGVDYGPDRVLFEAAQSAGIHTARFPYKTHMWLRRDHVTAALGYGARARLIWSAPDWIRPACGQHDYDQEGYVREHNQICTKPVYHNDDHGDWQPDPARCAECGGSYVDHYGKDGRKQDSRHSYKPAGVES